LAQLPNPGRARASELLFIIGQARIWTPCNRLACARSDSALLCLRSSAEGAATQRNPTQLVGLNITAHTTAHSIDVPLSQDPRSRTSTVNSTTWYELERSRKRLRQCVHTGTQFGLILQAER
jgi:hypothetical protein